MGDNLIGCIVIGIVILVIIIHNRSFETIHVMTGKWNDLPNKLSINEIKYSRFWGKFRLDMSGYKPKEHEIYAEVIKKYNEIKNK